MTNSPPSPQSPVTPSPVVLRIRGLGPLFNFKNSRFLARGRLMTDPALKKRMDAITRSLESQLRSHFQISEGATPTDAQRQSLTLSLPHDDCWEQVPELVITAKLGDDTDEGADITIERIELNNPQKQHT